MHWEALNNHINSMRQQLHIRQYKSQIKCSLDVKYSLTSNITADLTLNTDFAQVEVDDQMVNLTRFSLFFPEKRQFFLERSSIFNIQTGYLDQVFYSRRIGLYEGEIVPYHRGCPGLSEEQVNGILDSLTCRLQPLITLVGI